MKRRGPSLAPPARWADRAFEGVCLVTLVVAIGVPVLAGGLLSWASPALLALVGVRVEAFASLSDAYEPLAALVNPGVMTERDQLAAVACVVGAGVGLSLVQVWYALASPLLEWLRPTVLVGEARP